jgi:flagellar protein FliS
MDYRKINLRQEYLKQSVMTASPAELIVILYDACIKNLKLAEIDLIDHNDPAGAHTHFLNAQKIIMELVNCLDTSYELSVQLLEIYDFLLKSIREMNIKKDMTQLPDVLDIIASIRDTWQQISKSSVNCASEASCG